MSALNGMGPRMVWLDEQAPLPQASTHLLTYAIARVLQEQRHYYQKALAFMAHQSGADGQVRKP